MAREGVYAQMTGPACAEPLRLECLLYVRCPVAHPAVRVPRCQ